MGLGFFQRCLEKVHKMSESDALQLRTRDRGFKDTIEQLFGGVRGGGWGEQLYYAPNTVTSLWRPGRQGTL